MKKRIMLILLLVVVLFPITVRANIVCNDGTTSPSCADCHQGCCSHHSGCATYSSESNYRSNTTIRKHTVAPYTIKEEKDESSLDANKISKSADLEFRIIFILCCIIGIKIFKGNKKNR